jgi:hypothetical protein
MPEFSEAFLSGLIRVALIWTALGAVVLVALLIQDYRKGRIW